MQLGDQTCPTEYGVRNDLQGIRETRGSTAKSMRRRRRPLALPPVLVDQETLRSSTLSSRAFFRSSLRSLWPTHDTEYGTDGGTNPIGSDHHRDGHRFRMDVLVEGISAPIPTLSSPHMTCFVCALLGCSSPKRIASPEINGRNG